MRKNIVTALLAGTLSVSVLAGCGSSTGSAETAATTASTAASVEASTEETTEASAEETTYEALEPDADGNVTITDMAGRTVTYKANPMVWNSSPTATAWLCAIAPDQILGWSAEFTDEQLSYLPESVRDLAVIGGNYGDNEANVEAVLAAGPDVILNTYDCSEDALDATIQSADEMQEQYGIPVIVISRDIADTAEVAGLLGEWLGQPERGAAVQAYLQSLLDEIEATKEAVPEAETLSYYYAEGTDGLSTEAADSFHADVYTYCGLTAAVGDDLTQTSFGGMETVSFEQVLQWDPDVIFVWNAQAYEEITTGETWADVTAVKNGKVYLNPSLPQNWVDRTPNDFRVLGCLYTLSACYPDSCTFDLAETVKEYFSFMFDVDLTEEQMQALYTL